MIQKLFWLERANGARLKEKRGQTGWCRRSTKPVSTSKQVIEDRRKLSELRHEVACSLAKTLSQSETALPYTMSGDGYRVCRIGVGGAELLLAVRGGQGDIEVRYVYLNGKDKDEEPSLVTTRLPDVIGADDEYGGLEKQINGAEDEMAERQSRCTELNAYLDTIEQAGAVIPEVG